VTPIKKGTAKRLGLRKPTGVYRYRDGAIRDEIRLGPLGVTVDGAAARRRVKEFAEACGIHLQDWQLDWVAKASGL
jgi:hypothetical protein